MDTIKYILGLPEHVERAGDIYPVKVKDYDNFNQLSNVILFSYKQFSIVDDEIEKRIKNKELKLLDLILYTSLESKDGYQLTYQLTQLFNLVFKKEFKLNIEDGYFLSHDGESIIDRDNFDEVKAAIMKQNLLFEPPVYKNKVTQSIAEKVLKSRAKKALKASFEDMISTVAAMTGKDYTTLSEYTIYQLKSEFQRVLKVENYHTLTLFRSVGNEDVPEHFAEDLDIFSDPYKDIFKDKNKTLKNINNAVGK